MHLQKQLFSYRSSVSRVRRERRRQEEEESSYIIYHGRILLKLKRGRDMGNQMRLLWIKKFAAVLLLQEKSTVK